MSYLECGRVAEGGWLEDSPGNQVVIQYLLSESWGRGLIKIAHMWFVESSDYYIVEFSDMTWHWDTIQECGEKERVGRNNSVHQLFYYSWCILMGPVRSARFVQCVELSFCYSTCIGLLVGGRNLCTTKLPANDIVLGLRYRSPTFRRRRILCFLCDCL